MSVNFLFDCKLILIVMSQNKSLMIKLTTHLKDTGHYSSLSNTSLGPHLVYLNICTKYQTCENLSSIGRGSCEIIVKETTPLSYEVVCIHMLDLQTPKSNSDVSQSNSWKITSLSKTTLLQKERPFLTMFYTIYLSPLLVTK